jgi:hypothetical protein
MLSSVRRRLTYANVASTIALFLALGGGMAFALSRDSVRSKNIVDGQVKAVDLAGCPKGTKFDSGVCIEKEARAAETWDNAAETCAAADRRLPTVAELQSFRQKKGITLTSGGEFSSDVYVLGDGADQPFVLVAATLDDAGFQNNDNIRLGATGDIDGSPAASSSAFRCVATRPR